MAKTMKAQSRNTVNWDRTHEVEGRIVGIDSMTMEDGKVRPFLLIKTDKGTRLVYQSTGLDELFGVAKLGDFCSIEYIEKTTTKNNRTFRRFDYQIWEDDTAPVVVEEKVNFSKPDAPKGRSKGK